MVHQESLTNQTYEDVLATVIINKVDAKPVLAANSVLEGYKMIIKW